jgi:hypothetical protein
MITKEQVIREFLSDPLMLEKGYYTEGFPEKVKLNVKSESKMVELIKLLISGKFDDVADVKITRDINALLNETN